jgi:hypothetical protein
MAVSMSVFLAVAAFICASYIAWKHPKERAYAFGAVSAGALMLLLQFKLIQLRVPHASTVVWAAMVILGGMLWTRQQSKIPSTLAALLCAFAAVPLAIALGVIR